MTKKKAKIYKPTKTSMQSGLGKTKKWVLEYIDESTSINPLMGWESSTNTLSEIKLFFELFPTYKRQTFKKQKVFTKSDRV